MATGQDREVTEATLYTYVDNLFGSIDEAAFTKHFIVGPIEDNQFPTVRSAIEEGFGNAWNLFFDESSNLIQQGKLAEFMKTMYAGPLWQSRQSSFMVSGSYDSFFRLGDFSKLGRCYSICT
jgi:hypothetical protein